MFKKFTGLIVVAGLFLGGSAFAGTIVGSAHDFTDGVSRNGIAPDSWNPEFVADGADASICVICHAPHGNTNNASGELLWNHTPSALAGFVAYDSVTLEDTSVANIAGSSKLCLSCHDGVIALDSYGGAGGSVLIGTLNDSGPQTYDLVVDLDMSNDHPIGVDMVLAFATDPTLADPAAAGVTLGDGTTSGSIGSLMLVGDKVECSSCHDPHNTTAYTAVTGTNRLLRITNDSSALCLTCHEK